MTFLNEIPCGIEQGISGEIGQGISGGTYISRSVHAGKSMEACGAHTEVSYV